jgi:hypothetical protein
MTGASSAAMPASPIVFVMDGDPVKLFVAANGATA